MYHESPSRIIKKYKVGRSGNQKLSRYRNCEVCVNDNDIHYLRSPLKRRFKESKKDKIYIVEPGLEDRLDLVSFKFYNTPHLWWVIATINNIKNPMRLEVGVALRIPPLDEVSI